MISFDLKDTFFTMNTTHHKYFEFNSIFNGNFKSVSNITGKYNGYSDAIRVIIKAPYTSV